MRADCRSTIREKSAWASKVWAFFLDWWHAGAIGLSTLLLAIPTFAPHLPDLPRWLMFTVALGLLIVGGWGARAKRKSLDTAEEVIRTNRKTIDDLKADSLRAVNLALRELMKECALAESDSTSLPAQTFTRGTVYCHHPEERVFIPLARYSDNPVLQERGRDQYPDDEGLIKDVWATKHTNSTNLSKDRTTWESRLLTMHGIPPATSAVMRMQCLSLGGARMDHDGTKVGVIMVESEKALGVSARVVDDVESSKWFAVLTSLMASTQRTLVPEIAKDNGPQSQPEPAEAGAR